MLYYGQLHSILMDFVHLSSEFGKQIGQIVSVWRTQQWPELGKLSNRKSNETWELVQTEGGSSKNQKSPKFQLGKVQN